MGFYSMGQLAKRNSDWMEGGSGEMEEMSWSLRKMRRKNKQQMLRACGDISGILKTERMEMNEMGKRRRVCWTSKGREEMKSN